MISTEVLGSSEEVGSSASMQVGLLHQRAGDADALALAAGELVGALVGERAEPDRVEQLERAVDVLGVEPAQPRPPYRDIAEAAASARSRSPSGAPPGCIPGTPCRCGGASGAARVRCSLAMSWPRNRISPEVGSTSRLMQRISVDLPVPDGPMIAVMPRPSTVSETFFSTGWPARYSLRRLRITSERPALPPAASGLNGAEASIVVYCFGACCCFFFSSASASRLASAS